MTKAVTYLTCQICFDDLLAHANFVQLDAGILMDQIDTEYFVYKLDTSNPCENECHGDIVAEVEFYKNA